MQRNEKKDSFGRHGKMERWNNGILGRKTEP